MDKLLEKRKYMDWGLFAGALMVLCFFLARYSVYTLDADASSELVLAKHLFDHGGGVMSRNWYYSTEIKFLGDQLAFQLMFLFTDNWQLVRLGGAMLLVVLTLLSLWWLCRRLGIGGSFPLLGALILLPLSDTYFKYVLKFSYYLPYLIYSFMVMGAAVEPGSTRLRSALALTSGALISLAAGILGFRMLLTLYIPLALAVLLYLWLNRAGPMDKGLAKRTGLMVAAALLGCAIELLVISRLYTVFDHTGLSFRSFSLEGVEKTLAGLLGILGYGSSQEVFSQALLPTALSGLLLLLCLGCGIYILRFRERFSAPQQIAAYFYLAALLCLALLYSLTDMQYMSYHSIQAAIHGLPLIFICLDRRDPSCRAGRAMCLALVCCAMVCGALRYNDMRKLDETRGLREAARFLAQSEYKEGYASFWVGNLAAELSDGQVDIWVWDDLDLLEMKDPDDIVPWLQSKDHDLPPSQGKVFILMSANEAYYTPFAQGFTEEDVIFRTEGWYEGAVDEFMVFGFDSYEDMRAKFLSAFDE